MLFKKAAKAGSTESMLEYGKKQKNGCKKSCEFLNSHFKEPIEEASSQVKLTEDIKN